MTIPNKPLRVIGDRNPIYCHPRENGGLLLAGRDRNRYLLFSDDELAELADVIREVLKQPRIHRYAKEPT